MHLSFSFVTTSLKHVARSVSHPTRAESQVLYVPPVAILSTFYLFVCLLRVMLLLQSNAEIWVLRLLLGSKFEII